MPDGNPQRILVRGVNWLGDAVMSTPALQRLREARPGAHIILLTPAKLAELWRDHPAIDAVESFTDNESAWSIGKRLREGRFDIGLIFPNSPRSALELWLARIPERIGYAKAWRNFFLSRCIPPRPSAVKMHKRSSAEIRQLVNSNAPQQLPPASAHHVYDYLHLVSELGAKPEPLAPKLVVQQQAVTDFISKFKLPQDGSTLLLGLNAGAEYGPAKRWPEERFVETAAIVQRQTGCHWLVFGLKSESALAARIASQVSGAINLAGATSLGEFCAGLKLCRVLLTNDSGPMHVAAALGTPVVVPFGSTSPELTGPGLPGDTRHKILRSTVPCSPCFLRECPIDFRCMKGIAVKHAVAAVMELL